MKHWTDEKIEELEEEAAKAEKWRTAWAEAMGELRFHDEHPEGYKKVITAALHHLENATPGDEGIDWDFVFMARDLLRESLLDRNAKEKIIRDDIARRAVNQE